MGNILKSLFGKQGAPAGTKKESRKDPVCGMQVSNDSIVAEHNGVMYYFCSLHCKTQFVARADNFVD